jgi:hypothetical protein
MLHGHAKEKELLYDKRNGTFGIKETIVAGNTRDFTATK